MRELSILQECSVADIIREGVRMEQELLRFYEESLPQVGYDVRPLFMHLVEDSRRNLRLLGEKGRELKLMQQLTEPIAD